MNTLIRTIRLFAFLLIAAALPLSAVAQSPLQSPIQYSRPDGQAGVNMFEPPVDDTTSYDGFDFNFGGAFAQQLQAVSQSNSDAAPDLPEIGRGFNLATANLDLDVQMAEGIKLHVRTYLSSRHHPEAWVKGGYLQVDELPMFDSDAIDRVMSNLSVRAGHFMPNYGDAHFRRTDNADAIQNPFVGNNVLDAFTTEVGAEATFMSNGFLVVGGFGGALNPDVVAPDERTPSWHGKIGYDTKLGELARFRLTGSGYYTISSNDGSLHSGDRAGSRYYNVVDPALANDWSGRIRSSFGDQVTAFMVNPFVKIGGLELFGTIETVTGNRSGGLDDGSIEQYAGEAIYRFFGGDLFTGVRYNTMTGDLNLAGRGQPPSWDEVTVDRWQVSAGWFMTENILVKGEYVTQTYDDYPTGAPQDGAEFDGFMLEGVVSF